MAGTMVQHCDDDNELLAVASSVSVVRDRLPADLDITNHIGAYVVPNNARRRIPGLLYLLVGAVSMAVALIFTGDVTFVNHGFLAGGVVVLLFGLYHLQSSWHLATNEKQALMAAVRSVGFPVGHASAQLSWRGLRSCPTWRILLYSDGPEQASPKKRGLVLVDGITCDIVQSFVEDNPEDWATNK